jgi:hypothetical protein
MIGVRVMAFDEDDDQQVIEVFARFGRAMYMANVVEDQLVLTLMQVQFMRTKEDFVRAQGKGFDRATIEAEWNAYEKDQRKKTMGELRNLVKTSADFDEALKKRIDDAKARRDFLAHNYWREQALAMQTKEGREKMIAELTADTETFEKLAGDIREAMEPVRQKLGIKEEKLDALVEKQMANVHGGLPLK